jgi:hypothetical protein
MHRALFDHDLLGPAMAEAVPLVREWAAQAQP